MPGCLAVAIFLFDGQYFFSMDAEYAKGPCLKTTPRRDGDDFTLSGWMRSGKPGSLSRRNHRAIWLLFYSFFACGLRSYAVRTSCSPSGYHPCHRLLVVVRDCLALRAELGRPDWWVEGGSVNGRILSLLEVSKLVSVGWCVCEEKRGIEGEYCVSRLSSQLRESHGDACEGDV